MKIDSYDYFPVEKKNDFHSVITLIKPVFSKNQHHYHYNIFLEKRSYPLPEGNDNE